MKFNSIFNYLRKNKIIIAFIIILFIIFFNLSIFHLANSREGFSTDEPIGEYDYLAPIIPKDFEKKSEAEQLKFINNFWSDDTWKDFVSKWNSINCPSGKGNGMECLKYPPENLKSASRPDSITSIVFPLWQQISEPEAKYYGKNGYFPYNGFIMNSITENPVIFTNANVVKDSSGNPFTLEKAKQKFSNRFFYLLFIRSVSTNIMKNDSSDPLSYQIFEGRAKPPSSSLTSKPPVPPPSSPVSSLFSPPSTSSSPSSLFSPPSTSSSTKSSPISSLFSLPS
jgi:hypothetical protein